MATLLERLQQRMQGQAPTPAPQQQEIQRTLQARTGKLAGPGGGPRASSIAEQQTIQSGRAAAGQLAFQGRQQEMRQRQQEQAMQQQAGLRERGMEQRAAAAREELAARQRVNRKELEARAEEAAKRRDAAYYTKLDAMTNAFQRQLDTMASQRGIAMDDMFAQYRQNQQLLQDERSRLQLEQTLHNIALSNKKYIDQLNAIGQIRRLDNEQRFKEEAARTMIDDNLRRLEDQLDFNWDQDLKDADVRKKLAALGVDTKLRTYRMAAAAASEAAMVGGAAKVGKEGLQSETVRDFIGLEPLPKQQET